MRVLLLGKNGMLGNEILKTLSKDKYEILAFSRKDFDVEHVCNNKDYFHEFVASVGNVDFVINAIGITIPNSLKNPAMTYFINSTFPHILASQYGIKLIHITTDCVYSGTDGFPYNELSEHSPKDTYGLSKSLGESQDCITIRTSIIGTGGDRTGLLDWFLQQKGFVKGYTDHFWNGITTHQFALVCDKIMTSNIPRRGIYHVFSNTVSKYDMLNTFRNKFKVDCDLIPLSGNPVNRTLSTIYEFNSLLNNPSFEQMLDEMIR
jgi:dTDP-4-dehydrorhamnose reductase